MSKSNILTSWGICMLMIALAATPHSADAQTALAISDAAPAITSANGNLYYAWTDGPDYMCDLFGPLCS